MMVGEIRDEEPRGLRSRPAHRPPGVFDPSHERLAAALTRMVDIGIEPFWSPPASW